MSDYLEVRDLTCEETEELLPEYALGTLSLGEAAQVARHLRGCLEHVKSQDEYEAATLGLAASVSQIEPPARVRARLLASVADRPGAARRVWLGWLAAAATLVVALVVGAWGLSLQRQIDSLASTRKDLITIVQQPDAQMVALQTTEEGGAAKGVMIYSGKRAALWVVALPQLEGDQVYACWWVDGNNQRVLGGTFKPESVVSTWFIPMPDDSENYHLIGITLEPNPNITSPQGPKVMSGEF